MPPTEKRIVTGAAALPVRKNRNVPVSSGLSAALGSGARTPTAAMGRGTVSSLAMLTVALDGLPTA